MGNLSSKPNPQEDVSETERNQSSSTSVSGSAGTAATVANQDKKPSTLSDGNTVRGVARFLEAEGKLALASASLHHTSVIFADPYDVTLRNKKITLKLLHAVAYGMESRDVNVDHKPNDLFAKDLLRRSPEFLLERAHLEDWAGRTFKGRITEDHPEGEGIIAFEYALWAKDFKMLEMMLGCIPETAEGNRIRVGLLEQYEQVTAPHMRRRWSHL